MDFPHYGLVPKDFKANLRWRRETLRAAAEDLEFAAAIKAMCAADVLFYINGFCWTFDPRDTKMPARPFITYREYQDAAFAEFVEAVEEGYDLAWPKSRTMGASWMGVTGIEWFWHFRDSLSFLFVSRNADYVDKRGNPKCLFWKALTLDTPVVTPTGLVPVSELRRGDLVTGSDGRGHAVVEIIDHGVKPIYRVSFGDGTSVRCCGDHEWSVTGVASRHGDWLSGTGRQTLVVKKTSEMVLDFHRVYRGRGRTKSFYVFKVPLSAPVVFDCPSELPIPPYVFGALLGDGCFSKPAVEICGIDEEIFGRIRGLMGKNIVKTGRCSYIFRGGPGHSGELQRKLKDLGLRGCRSWEKFIPKQYLFASVESRLELLRGLMDTRGGGCPPSFLSTSRQLAEDVAFLVRSLGGCANAPRSYPAWYNYEGERLLGRKAYRFTFSLGFNPFHLKRKAERYNGHRRRFKSIVNIESCGVEPVRCISVDAPDSLYLVDGFSLTHNCDFLHQNQPRWLLPSGRWMGSRDPNRTLLHLENYDNGSVIDGESTTSDAGRGDRRTAMFIDEFAAFEVAEGYQVLNATRDTTKCRVFNSTPQGVGNAFYDVVHKTGARVRRMHWSEHPEYKVGLYTSEKVAGEWRVKLLDGHHGVVKTRRKEWRGEFRKFLFPGEYPFVLDGKMRSPWFDTECSRCSSEQEIAQELDINFLGSAYQFFPAEFIQMLIAEYCTPPQLVGRLVYDPDSLTPRGFEPDPSGPLSLWFNIAGGGGLLSDRTFFKGKSFGLGADVSFGSGASNSAASLVDLTSGRKVAVWRDSRTEPKDFADESIALARWFNEAFLIWDASGAPGRSFTMRVLEQKYSRIYYRKDEERTRSRITDQPGYYLNPEDRAVLLREYKDKLGERQFINPSELGMRECLQFVVQPGGKVEHSGAASSQDPRGAREAHGDEAIADALASRILVMKALDSKPAGLELPYMSPAWRLREYELAKGRAGREDW